MKRLVICLVIAAFLMLAVSFEPTSSSELPVSGTITKIEVVHESYVGCDSGVSTFYHVYLDTGHVHSFPENTWGHFGPFKVGDKVELYKDPMGCTSGGVGIRKI